ncbi:MAG: hypothetical protein R2838_06515 [Caldilineaceae bacterium]
MSSENPSAASAARSSRGTSPSSWPSGRSRRRWREGNTVILKPASYTPLKRAGAHRHHP